MPQNTQEGIVLKESIWFFDRLIALLILVGKMTDIAFAFSRSSPSAGSTFPINSSTIDAPSLLRTTGDALLQHAQTKGQCTTVAFAAYSVGNGDRGHLTKFGPHFGSRNILCSEVWIMKVNIDTWIYWSDCTSLFVFIDVLLGLLCLP